MMGCHACCVRMLGSSFHTRSNKIRHFTHAAKMVFRGLLNCSLSPRIIQLSSICPSLTFATEAGPTSAPLMSGAGGNYVSSLPDGRVVVILSKDDYNNDWPDEARQALLSALANR
jgi:hypothetical protein